MNDPRRRRRLCCFLTAFALLVAGCKSRPTVQESPKPSQPPVSAVAAAGTTRRYCRRGSDTLRIIS